MATTLHETRKTWLWFEAYGEPLEETDPGAGLASRMAWQAGYEALLADVRRSEGPLTLPWPPGSGLSNNFWRLYLEGSPESANGTRCWRHLMPLRFAVPTGGDGSGLRVNASGLPAERFTLEAFLYPHGVGLAATAFLRKAEVLPAVTDRMRACQQDAVLRLVEDGESRGPFRLPILVDPLLDALRRSIGAPGEAEHRSGPFSIATVVQAEIEADEQKVVADSPQHRALEGLRTGAKSWAETPARPLEPPWVLETQLGPEENLLLAGDDSRLVWLPHAAVPGPGRQSSLGCYHRNLTMLSLQVESLLGLVRLAHADLKSKRRVRSGRMEDLVSLAAGTLGRLYGCNESTYRSASAPAQIDAGGRKEMVDEVRELLGLGPALFR